jgi:thiamine-phosphate pyrophosphorylase
MSQVWAGPLRSSTGPARRAQLKASRLYLVTDDETPAAALPQLIARAVEGGVDVIQLRRKGEVPKNLVALARECLRSARDQGALFLIDDHLELALEVDADGVHLGQGDLDAAEARIQLGPDRLLGLSTHTKDQVLRAGTQPVDYISAGPVYATPTKPGRPAVGFEHVTLAAGRSAVPVVAIGGLRSGRAAPAIAAGADLVAVVRAICRAEDPAGAAAALRAEIDSATAWPRLRVNGQDRKCVPGSSVHDLLVQLEVELRGVVVELDGQILAEPELAGALLREGDQLEIVHLVGGGSGHG